MLHTFVNSDFTDHLGFPSFRLVYLRLNPDLTELDLAPHRICEATSPAHEDVQYRCKVLLDVVGCISLDAVEHALVNVKGRFPFTRACRSFGRHILRGFL